MEVKLKASIIRFTLSWFLLPKLCNKWSQIFNFFLLELIQVVYVSKGNYVSLYLKRVTTFSNTLTFHEALRHIHKCMSNKMSTCESTTLSRVAVVVTVMVNYA